MEEKSIVVDLGRQKLIFSTGKIAKQANGSVMIRDGETVLLATACAAPEPAEGTDFFPLKVDYQEKFSSAGKTLSGFIKREGRPSERETLLSRMTDRSIRPMFADGYNNEVQVLTTLWSCDSEHLADPLTICAASAALLISDIPFEKAVAGVQLGFVNGKFIVNPSSKDLETSKCDALIAGTEDAILMIEGHCNFLTEAEVVEGIEVAHQAIIKICKALTKWQQEVGKKKIRDHIKPLSKEVINAVRPLLQKLLKDSLNIQEKQLREAAFDAAKQEVCEHFCPKGQETSQFPLADVKAAFKKVTSEMMRQMVLKTKKRCDGRSLTEIRPISIENGLLPRTHGSSLFTRGETQTIAVCTLGGESSAQRYETVHIDSSHRFYLQYSFPPYSVGEVGRFGAPGRREIGHGKLAERALVPCLPSKESFPYIIRLESNITESNGSSSMASVCGGILAMMDAGVPIKRPVSGIAMGLILEGDEFVILSDILGIEDALGDMDFKVTGDHEGITAFQMDIKVEGITKEIMAAALAQAKQGRMHILDKMLVVCPSSKKEMSVYAPRIETIRIKPNKIAVVIGPGGKQIRAIIEQTGVEIDIDDEGLVSIAATDEASMLRAKEIILALVEEVQVGRVYKGKVAAIAPFGAFIEILPGKEGLCHISELSVDRIENISDHIKEGDEMRVKVLAINERGQLKLSHKAVILSEK